MWKQKFKLILWYLVLIIRIFFMFFCISTNPLICALRIIITSFFSGFLIFSVYSKWICLILIIVFIGGIIVVFLYVSSLAINKKIVLIFTKNSAKLSIFFFIRILRNIFSPVLIGFNPNTLIFSSYQKISTLTIIFLIAYLLLALILVVKNSESFKGSLVEKF